MILKKGRIGEILNGFRDAVSVYWERRLIIVFFVLVGAAVTISLVLSALTENINLFYPPDAVVAGEAPVGARIRAGGMAGWDLSVVCQLDSPLSDGGRSHSSRR